MNTKHGVQNTASPKITISYHGHVAPPRRHGRFVKPADFLAAAKRNMLCNATAEGLFAGFSDRENEASAF